MINDIIPENFIRKHVKLGHVALEWTDGVCKISGIHVRYIKKDRGFGSYDCRQALDLLLGEDFMNDCDKVANTICKEGEDNA